MECSVTKPREREAPREDHASILDREPAPLRMASSALVHDRFSETAPARCRGRSRIVERGAHAGQEGRQQSLPVHKALISIKPGRDQCPAPAPRSVCVQFPAAVIEGVRRSPLPPSGCRWSFIAVGPSCVLVGGSVLVLKSLRHPSQLSWACS